MYRKIMLYHNIINGEDDRLIKKMIEEQEKTEEDGTWYAGVHKYLKMLNIDVGMVKESSKSTVKKMVKEQITKRMTDVTNMAKQRSTKMRFLDCEVFQLSEYIKRGNGGNVLQTIKT